MIKLIVLILEFDLAAQKFCVFCGEEPESKNKEHVLPQWLLKMTGDPRRVVTMGFNYKTQREISFDWTSLVVPACEACNTEFSTLEGEVRPLIESLLKTEALRSVDYFVLLDWLDKVRVGLWLNYHMLQGNPGGIEPSFHIKSRLRKKDRFLAVYPIASNRGGLTPIGVETLAFSHSPSVFGLRINNIFILNCSSDYLFSARCGFPYPSRMEVVLDGENVGLMQLEDFNSTSKTKHPLLRFSLCKPSVLILQPIMQASADLSSHVDGGFLGGDPLTDKFLIANTMGDKYPGIGKLYRQFDSGVVRLDDENELIDFDSITGSECKPFFRLASQVYDLQIYLQSLYLPLAHDLKVRAAWNERQKIMKAQNKAIIRSLSR